MLEVEKKLLNHCPLIPGMLQAFLKTLCGPSEWTSKFPSFALPVFTKTPAYLASAFPSTHRSFSCRQAPNTATSQQLTKLQSLWDSSRTDRSCSTKQPLLIQIYRGETQVERHGYSHGTHLHVFVVTSNCHKIYDN